MPEAILEARIAVAEAVAIFKVGRHLDKVRRILDRLQLSCEAFYVERATLPNQRVVPLTDLDDKPAPYFTTILVRRRETRFCYDPAE